MREVGLTEGGGPGPRTRAFVAWTLRHGVALWAVALALAVPAAVRTASLYLHLRSDVEALLPRKAPSVRALNELRARMPGMQHLGVVVDTGSADRLGAGERLLDDLAAKIRQYPASLVRSVRTGDEQERRFIEDHAVLYVDLADLRTVRERIERRRDYEVTRAMGIDLEEEQPPPLDFSEIHKKYEDRALRKNGVRERARYSSPELHTTMLVVELASFEMGGGLAEKLLSRVKSDVAALGGTEHYAPGMRLGYSSDVAISVEELTALRQDLSLSSVLVVIAVGLVIVLYYRWPWCVIALVPPLLLAAVYAFALGSLPPFNVRELNANTGFLGSIIIGNGINFGILLLARHVEERRRGRTVFESLVIASWGARSGTLAASLAAGASYAALSLTGFQGFRQFGFIGGMGMVLSWTFAQVLIPPLVFWLDRGEQRAVRPLPPRATPVGMIASLVSRAPGVMTAMTVVLVVLAGWQSRSFGSSFIETDFSKLRRADTWVSGEGYWGRRMDELLGSYLTPIDILTDDGSETRSIAAHLRSDMKSGSLSAWVSRVVTADDVLPPDQPAKIEEENRLRRVLTPRIRSEMAEDERKLVDRFLAKPDVVPFDARDLPPGLTTGLRERNGRIDRAVLVFPRPSRALWEGETIERFVESLRAVAAQSGGRPGRVAGSLPVSRDILQGVRRDGPMASLIAFLGVVVTVVAVFRLTAISAVVLGSLVIGVLWLLATLLTFGVRINFVNFIAFPITFGIGVDYAVNVMTRYVLDGVRDVSRAIRSTGGAVALCSSTTIIGYSSLLLAKNRALWSFGLLAVFGEVACLTSAVIALPAAIELWNRRHLTGTRWYEHFRQKS